MSLLLLAGMSACSGEKSKEPVVSGAVESTTVPADTLPQNAAAASPAGELSPEMQHHVHEIDSLLDGI
ncbi:hypothetical protein [Cesiribacter sp. SM1]|uniref:hypothetical protein n=1 Tax=Cesiribacter sp. SM1 TaxID=2861196 RepID=UPI001CD24A35|nr:hypothetical protein [Cesiribacter sp. SM1]